MHTLTAELLRREVRVLVVSAAAMAVRSLPDCRICIRRCL